MVLRYPELVGSPGSDLIFSAGFSVALGLAGDDDLGGGVSIRAGGSGDDAYYIDQPGVVTVVDRSGVLDTVVVSSVGFGRDTTGALTLDGRHMFLFDTAASQGVILLDWQVPALRIENIRLENITYDFAGFAAALAGFAGYLGDFTWEAASAAGYLGLGPGEDTVTINESLEHYRAYSIARENPAFGVTDTGTGDAGNVVAVAYAGPVARLDLQFVGGDGGEAIAGTAFSDFVNAAGGNDAIDGGLGDDVIDGGTGSNFLTGGAGTDTFFLDGRGGAATWSTITDWEAGEQLSLWGWLPGISSMSWEEQGGIPEWAGATLHCDLDGDGAVETSVTWSGRTQADLPTPHTFEGLLWFV
jgi:Ca2+-binding RTX toxin-like protein